MSFNYGLEDGVEVVVGTGGVNEKLIPAGDYAARLVAIIHLGVCPKKKFKSKEVDMVPCAVAVFELVDNDENKDIYEDDGTTQQHILKDFVIKEGGGKSDMDKIIAFGDSEANGFDDLIDNVYTIKVVHSKCGKYCNLASFTEGGLSSYPKKFWKNENASQIKLGQVKYSELTKEAVELLHSWNHVADLLIKGANYAGSKAEEVIKEIRSEEGREDFGKKVKKSDKKDDKPNETVADKPQPEDDGADVKPSEY
jgi:hypothetical protein